MIVERWTIPRESGKADQVLAMLKERDQKLPAPIPPHARRIYKRLFAEGGEIVVETEWESLAELEAFYVQNWSALPEDVLGDWKARFSAVTRAGGACEIWQLED